MVLKISSVSVRLWNFHRGNEYYTSVGNENFIVGMKISFTEKIQDEYQNHRFDSSDSANSKNRVRWYFNLQENCSPHDLIKWKRFKKIAWIWSHHLQLRWKFKLFAWKFAWGNKAKHCLVMDVNKLFVHSQKCFAFTFPPIIWIFNEGEGDVIKSRLPFKKMSTNFLYTPKNVLPLLSRP